MPPSVLPQPRDGADLPEPGRPTRAARGRLPRPARRILPGARPAGRAALGLALCVPLLSLSCAVPGDAAAPDVRSRAEGGASSASRGDGTRPSYAGPRPVSAVQVLGAWDRSRARAFADGDLAALRRLYVAGSTAGAADVRLLRAYGRRGLRVEGMRVQVLALEVLGRTPTRWTLLVTDRLAGAVAVGRGTRTALPRDRASRRVVVLRRSRAGDLWRVAEVSESTRRRAGR